MSFDWSRYIQSGKSETRERLQALNDALLRLEGEPGNAACIDEAFRHAHSIKGTAQMVGLDLVSRIAHALEDVLGAVRAGNLAITPHTLDTTFRALDTIQQLLEELPDHTVRTEAETLIHALAAVIEGEEAAAVSPAGSGEEAPVPAEAAPQLPSPTVVPPVLYLAPRAVDDTMRVSTERVDRLLSLMGELTTLNRHARAHVADLRALYAQLRRAHASLAATAGDPRRQAGVEELAQALRAAATLERQVRRQVSAREIITQEAQDAAMDLRLLPVSTLFERFPRAVRDLAQSSGKEVRLVIEGEETRLDKKILDDLYDPVLHLVRNAISHGIEKAREREAAGKPAAGTLSLRAIPHGREVLLQVADDGRGIDGEKVRATAVARGLMGQAEAAALTGDQVLQLLFRPGFSTAASIDEISGRGVGLDVVQSNVHNLKGAIRLETHPGRGCTFTLSLPLTVATTRVLLVECGRHTYALPGASVRAALDVSRVRIQPTHGRPTLLWEGHTVPLFPLASVLGLGQTSPRLQGVAVLVQYPGGIGGIVADRLLDEEEVILKPLGKLLQGTPLASSGLVLPDGRVALLLNPDAVCGAESDARQPAPNPGFTWQAPAPPTILLADDMVTTREVERAILGAVGYEVVTARDGTEAWELLCERPFDLVVSDVEMPGMDGIALTRKITADPHTSHIPVIIISGQDSDEDRRRGLEAGAAAYIVKSAFDQENLLALIKRLLR